MIVVKPSCAACSRPWIDSEASYFLGLMTIVFDRTQAYQEIPKLTLEPSDNGTQVGLGAKGFISLNTLRAWVRTHQSHDF